MTELDLLVVLFMAVLQPVHKLPSDVCTLLLDTQAHVQKHKITYS